MVGWVVDGRKRRKWRGEESEGKTGVADGDWVERERERERQRDWRRVCVCMMGVGDREEGKTWDGPLRTRQDLDSSSLSWPFSLPPPPPTFMPPLSPHPVTPFHHPHHLHLINPHLTPKNTAHFSPPGVARVSAPASHTLNWREGPSSTGSQRGSSRGLVKECWRDDDDAGRRPREATVAAGSRYPPSLRALSIHTSFAHCQHTPAENTAPN